MARTLRIGYLSTLYHTSHLLRHLGWVDRELGLDCLWILLGTGPEMVVAFQRGEIDLGYIGLPPAMIGMSKGIPLVCVGGGHVEGTLMVAGTAYRSLEEADDASTFLEQFRGRRVGIPAAGSIHDVIFRSFLSENAVGDVAIVNYAWADLIPYAFRKGEIVAAVGTPPLAVLCERDCGTHTLIPAQGLWPFNPSYGILTQREMLGLESLVEGFLSLHEKACNLIREDPERAARTTVKALPGLDDDFVRQVYAVSPRYCASLPDAYIRSTLAFIPVLKSMGYLDAPLGPEGIFETGLIRKVHSDTQHYR